MGQRQLSPSAPPQGPREPGAPSAVGRGSSARAPVPLLRLDARDTLPPARSCWYARTTPSSPAPSSGSVVPLANYMPPGSITLIATDFKHQDEQEGLASKGGQQMQDEN